MRKENIFLQDFNLFKSRQVFILTKCKKVVQNTEGNVASSVWAARQNLSRAVNLIISKSIILLIYLIYFPETSTHLNIPF